MYDDDYYGLFQVRLLDNYKDRSPGLHMRTLPSLVPTSHSLVHHQNFRKRERKERKQTTLVPAAHLSSSQSSPHPLSSPTFQPQVVLKQPTPCIYADVPVGMYYNLNMKSQNPSQNKTYYYPNKNTAHPTISGRERQSPHHPQTPIFSTSSWSLWSADSPP